MAYWGNPRAIPDYYPVFGHPTCPRLPIAIGDISSEVFSTSEPSAWRSLVETPTSIQGQATRNDDDDDDDNDCYTVGGAVVTARC